MISALFQGCICTAPSLRTDKDGNTYATVLVRVAIGEDWQHAYITFFGDSEQKHVLALNVGDSIAVSGELMPRALIEGETLHTWLDVTGYGLMSTYQVASKRQEISPDLAADTHSHQRVTH